MKKFIHATVAACLMGMFMVPEASAMPANGAAVVEQAESNNMVQDARVYCYNRYTGRFLHWGSCGGGYRRRIPGRVYCYNRYTGRFLHWGHC